MMRSGMGRALKPRCAAARRSLIASTLAIPTLTFGGAWYGAYLYVSEALGSADAGPSFLLAGAIGGAAALGLVGIGVGIVVRLYEAALTRTTRRLEQELSAKHERELATQHALIFGLARLADHRDRETGRHIDRICGYSRLLAERLRARHPEIDEAWIDRLELAASLHDIGKVGVPDGILLKPGPLTTGERERMQEHARIGGETLRLIRARLGRDEQMDMSIEVAEQHHERWDGGGYPRGLRGEGIALSARIVALADVYDAMTSARVYRGAASHEEVVGMIRRERAGHFDPSVVDAFLGASEDFDAVRRRLHEPEEVAEAA